LYISFQRTVNNAKHKLKPKNTRCHVPKALALCHGPAQYRLNYSMCHILSLMGFLNSCFLVRKWDGKSSIATHGIRNEGISQWMMVFNVTKALLGAGVVGIPMVFAHATLIPAIVFLIISAIISGFSAWCLAYLSHCTGISSTWGLIWKRTFNATESDTSWLRTGKIVDIIVLLFTYFNSMCYIMIATTNLTQMVEFSLKLPQTTTQVC